MFTKPTKRTYFPDAYRKHYPNAKTHISTRVRSVDSHGKSLFGEGAIRRERKQFSVEEDEALKKGYAKVHSHFLLIYLEFKIQIHEV